MQQKIILGAGVADADRAGVVITHEVLKYTGQGITWSSPEEVRGYKKKTRTKNG